MKHYIILLLIILQTTLYGSEAEQKAGIIETATAHLQAIRDDDLSYAYEVLSSDEFREGTTLNEFAKLLKQYPQFRTFHGFSLEGITLFKDAAIWNGTLRDKNGVPCLNVSYILVYEDDEWMIHRMQAGPADLKPPYQEANKEGAKSVNPKKRQK